MFNALRGPWRAFALALSVSLAAPVLAAAPPAAPLLRIEPGMHVNIVRAVAVDGAGQFAVTVSDDKTARIWTVATGAAGPVLRVPIDDGIEGRLQAAAMSRDGNQVAVAGRTGASWAGTQSIYVFDRASGRLLRRIDTRSPNPVVTLALSPDGRSLAAGLGGTGGVRIFDFFAGGLLAQDVDYEDSVYALDFSSDGQRLVAGAADGRLRLYAVQQGRLTLAHSGAPEVGKLIAQARFSPDGKLIAVGFEDARQVLLLDGASLNIVGAPAVPAEAGGVFSSLAWSPDGSELWGGGTHRRGGEWLLRSWPRGNWSQPTDRAVASSSVLALSTLSSQRVLFVSGEPAWGYVDAAGQVQKRAQSPVASFNSMARQFQVSADGQRVRFWYGWRKPMFEFDLPARTLGPAGDAKAPGWSLPRLQAPDLQVGGWENARRPVLNGDPLPLGELETSRSLAISGDGQRFVLGTDEGLRAFDVAGRPLWSRRTPGLVWALNFAAGDRLLLAAGQDGTIRWYRADNGQELLALLPHADQRRWALWSPSGFFDAAVGAEDLLGWHINRRIDAKPDFYPLWTLRSRLRRPDVLDRLLETGDERQALRVANQIAGKPDEPVAVLVDSLPPVLELTGSPEVKTASRDLALRVTLRTLPGAPVTGLRVRADGRPAVVETVGAPKAGADGTEDRELRIRFGGQPQQLQLLAENRFGLSAPATLSLVWTAPPPAEAPLPAATPAPAAPPVAAAPTAAPAAAPPVAATRPPAADGAGFNIQPKLYILAIGVGKFQSKEIGPLEFPAKDVQDFVASLQKQKGKLYRGVEARVLTNEKATRDSIVDGLDWLQREVTQHDVGMLFVSGHGHNDPTLGYMYIPYGTDFQSMRRTTVNMSDFKRTLDNLAGKALFFIDTCHSGNVLGGKSRSVVPNDVSGVINELISAESGVVVFSASTGRQLAYEKPEWGNGAFTKALIEGIDGKADYRKTGRVTHKMLDLYVAERVKELTDGRQSPVTQSPGGTPDFPLALSR